MKYYSFILVCLILTSCQFRDEQKMVQLSSSVDSLSNLYAPDKRVAIFDIKLSWSNHKLVVSGQTDQLNAYRDLIALLEKSDLPYQDMVLVLPDSLARITPYALVNNSVANLRSQPGHSSELATQALLGTEVKVLKVQDEWYLVQTPDQYIAWVDHGGVELMDSAMIQEWRATDKVLVTTMSGFVHQDSQVVSDVVMGDVLSMIGETEVGFDVVYPDGRTGQIDKENVIRLEDWKTSTIPNGERLVSISQQFVGLPYLWGGTSPKAVDCSGFTKMIYAMNGMIIARDASQQVYQGVLVDEGDGFSNLAKGDLLFFGKEATDSTKRKVTHVGMWIGDNMMIHASQRVRLSSFDSTSSLFDAHNLNRYLETRRLLP